MSETLRLELIQWANRLAYSGLNSGVDLLDILIASNYQLNSSFLVWKRAPDADVTDRDPVGEDPTSGESREVRPEISTSIEVKTPTPQNAR